MIFSFIDFNNIVVDLLHLTLRITDKLFEMLLFRLEELEDKKKRDLTEIFKNFLEKKCNINNPFIYSETSIKLRTLNQNERLKIFDKLIEIDNDDSDEDISDEDDEDSIKQRKRLSRERREKKKRTSIKPLLSIFPFQFQKDLTLNRLNDLCLKFRNILNIIKSENCRILIQNLKKD